MNNNQYSWHDTYIHEYPNTHDMTHIWSKCSERTTHLQPANIREHQIDKFRLIMHKEVVQLLRHGPRTYFINYFPITIQIH